MKSKINTRFMRVLNVLSYITLLVAVIGMIIIGYWMAESTDVITVKEGPVPVEPAFVKQEGYVTITLTYCKNKDVVGQVSRRLVSERSEVIAPTITDRTSRGCFEDQQVVVPIPAHTAPDEYRIVYEIDYELNPLRHVTERFESEPFTVITSGSNGPIQEE